VVFNPKDTNTFASASLDRTVKARPGWLRAPRSIVPRPAARRGASAPRAPGSQVNLKGSLAHVFRMGYIDAQALVKASPAARRQDACALTGGGARALPYPILYRAQVWSIGQPTPNFTLEGHEKGVNCVDYFNGGAAPRAARALTLVPAAHPAGPLCTVPRGPRSARGPLVPQAGLRP